METAVDLVRSLAGEEPVDTALILGSGLSHIADMVDGIAIPFDTLTGFPRPSVSGHTAQLVIGQLHGRRVVVLGGRAHYYEQGDAAVMRGPIEVLAALGVTRLFITNAAGSLDPRIGPGDLMLITDHINFSGRNPLIGEQSEQRFVNMVDAYCPRLRQALAAAAAAEGVPLAEGVYAWYSGPTFETPAEIRALRTLGADAVGMSTVPEVILARFFGLRVGAISVVTNMAAGMSAEVLSHNHTKAIAPLGAPKLERILTRLLSSEEIPPVD